MSDNTDRLFWEAIYRALMAICNAIKRYKLGGEPAQDLQEIARNVEKVSR